MSDVNTVKLAVVAAFGTLAEAMDIALSDEQDNYLNGLVDNLPMQQDTIPQGTQPADFIINKIKTTLESIDSWYLAYECMKALED